MCGRVWPSTPPPRATARPSRCTVWGIWPPSSPCSRGLNAGEELPARIADEVLHTYAVVGTYPQIGRKLVARYRGLVTDVEFSIPAATAGEQGILRELVQDIRRETA